MTKPISLRGVSYAYQTHRGQVFALQGVDLLIPASQFCCVLGPSGCGKTTMMNLVAGFLQPTAGSVDIDGKPIREGASDRGVVFQDFSQLFPWRTIRGNVEFGLEIRGMAAARRRERAEAILDLVGLNKFAQSHPHQLSGGMQQRAAIARALAYDPPVLLMDEPFAALDAMTREVMQNLLAEIWQKTRKTVLYITHNATEAAFLGERVVVLSAHPGRIKKDFAVDLPRPRDPLSDAFVRKAREIVAALAE